MVWQSKREAYKGPAEHTEHRAQEKGTHTQGEKSRDRRPHGSIACGTYLAQKVAR